MGGTFDPIHFGHLDVAIAAADALGLDEVRLLPSHVPPHRDPPRASPFHRFAMVAIAAAADRRLAASDTELLRGGASYAADTLRDLQQQGWSAGELFFITGADAFAEIATWKDYPALLDLSHFIVCSRPGHRAAVVRGLLPGLEARIVSASEFTGGAATRIILLDALTSDASSTAVREAIACDAPIGGIVAPAVAAHIRKHGLYTH
jgi:nicotinate-nucleotide adenylyltransferase